MDQFATPSALPSAAIAPTPSPPALVIPLSDIGTLAASIGIFLFVAAVAVALIVVFQKRLRSQQTLVTAAILIVSGVAIVVALPQVTVLLRPILLAALVVVTVFCVFSVTISEKQGKRFEQLLDFVTKEDRVAARRQFDNAFADLRNSDDITAAIVSWPMRASLREQVVDLIRNARNAANALREAPEEKFMDVLVEVTPPFVDPVVAIRQALEKVLGYPLAATLYGMPVPKEREDFERLADAHERILRLIPPDAPAVRLTAPSEQRPPASDGNGATEITEQA